MVDMSDWSMQCENCGRYYDIHEDIPAKFDKIDGREQLVLKASPKCPFCHEINLSLPRWK